MLRIVYNGEMDPRQGKAVTGKVIPELLANDPKIVYLDADLMSCIGTLKLAKDNDRVIECGIAEANMVGVAAGLAAAGFKPICHSFGIFSSRRAFDQAFLSAGYAKNDITILGSDAGVSAALNGGTHMPFEDMALYSALPEATVIAVSDATCLDSVLRQCPDLPGVKYIRFSRKDYAKIYDEGSELPIGRAVTLREGDDVVIFACGLMLHEALKAAETLAREHGISAAVVDCFTVKPIDREAVAAWAKKCGAAVVAENHNRFGGLYSAVSQVLLEEAPVPAGCVAVEDEFGEVGPQSYLAKRFGLTAEHIVSVAKDVIARKRRAQEDAGTNA